MKQFCDLYSKIELRGVYVVRILNHIVLDINRAAIPFVKSFRIIALSQLQEHSNTINIFAFLFKYSTSYIFIL